MERTGFNAYTLKMIAIIGMIMQHAAIVIGPVIPAALHFPLHFGGGLTFPIMAFFAVEGYRHTSNLKKYMSRIFIFGLISQIPFVLAFAGTSLDKFGMEANAFMFVSLNIMFIIFIGLCLVIMYDRMKARWLFWLLCIIILLLTILFSWGLIGPLMILLYHIIRSDKARKIVVPIMAGGYNIVFSVIIGIVVVVLMLTGALDGIIDTTKILEAEMATTAEMVKAMAGLMFPIGSFAVIPLLLKYNGQKGRSMKYLFYIVYPAHLLILALLAYAFGFGSLALIGIQ